MKTTLYSITVPIFIKHLTALSAILDKAVIHADERKINIEDLLNGRLIEDQFHFIKQVQVACDHAKGFTPRLHGADPVVMEDIETTVADLKARIDKTIDILKAVKPEEVEGQEEAHVHIKWFPGKYISGFDYATEYVLPNFYFHITTAYDILRHNGVQLGKADFIGNISLRDDA